MKIKTITKENVADKKHSNVKSPLLSFKAPNLRGGFSFIELIVAISIMAIITSAILLRQAKFSSDILITNMTYEIALAIRQAQVYGISSREGFECDGEDDPLGCNDLDRYKVGYGIHFEPSFAEGSDGNKPTTYIDFIDLPTEGIDTGVGFDTVFNYRYDQGDELVNISTLAQGKIRKYCAYDSSYSHVTNGPWRCGPADDGFMTMDIVFVKPNPDAHITIGSMGTGGGGISYTVNEEYDKAKIIVESALGDKCRTVTVYGTGQISVDPVDPADPDNGCGGIE